MRDLESLTYFPGAEEASAESDNTIGRCTLRMKGAKHCPKLGESPYPKTRGVSQVYRQTKSSTMGGRGRVGIFFTFEQSLLSTCTCSMPPKLSSFTLHNGAFIARQSMGVTNLERCHYKTRQSFATLDTIKHSWISPDLCGCQA